jgi:integrase/recombinase XerD
MARTKRYAERVNILKKVRVAGSWRLASVLERNGKIVRDHVLISGHDEHHPEGGYYLEWYQEGRRRRQAIADFSEVVEAARRKSIEVNAQKAGIIERGPEPEQQRVTISQAIDDYLDFIKAHRKQRTYVTYRYTLDKLLKQWCRRSFVDQITREDILQFMTDCYKRGLGKRTVYDKLVVVLQLFKRHGKIKLIEPSDWPHYVETIRPIYEAEEIAAMLEHADQDEAIFLKFLLASGSRDREVRHVAWRDMDFRNSVVRVTAKPLWGFGPKNWEERAVPLPSALVEQLKTLRQRRNGLPSQLVFPNSRGNPDSENDMIVKRVAERAQLNLTGHTVGFLGGRTESFQTERGMRIALIYAGFAEFSFRHGIGPAGERFIVQATRAASGQHSGPCITT